MMSVWDKKKIAGCLTHFMPLVSFDTPFRYAFTLNANMYVEGGGGSKDPKVRTH